MFGEHSDGALRLCVAFASKGQPEFREGVKDGRTEIEYLRRNGEFIRLFAMKAVAARQGPVQSSGAAAGVADRQRANFSETTMSNSLEHEIAYQLYPLVQVGVSKARLERSILSVARMFPTLNPLDYTQGYFIEEMIFVSVLILEAEIMFGFISWMIDAWEKERGLPRPVEPADVYRGMKEIAYPVACERMRVAGLEPATLGNAAALEGRLFSRFAEYEQLANDAVTCSIPVPERNWSAGLSHRDHPMEKYLGAASDHFCEALSGPIEAIDRVAIEMAVLQKWNITMETARKLRHQ